MAKDTAQHDHDPRRYWTQMLNMAEDDLGPFEYRLLAHYVRWASEGWKPEGYKTAAKRCKMSPQAFLRARDSLVALGYIRYNAPTAAQANKGIGGVIIVVDRWKENMDRYTPSQDRNQVNGKPGYDVNQLEEPSTEELNTTTFVAKNATGIETDLSVKGEQPTTPDTNKPKTPPVAVTPPKLRPRDPIFDAVAEYIFGVTDPAIRLTMQPDETPEGKKQRKTTNTLVGIIKSWLKREIDYIPYGKSSKHVGYISEGEIKPEHVRQFAAWYHKKNPTASMVTDGEKFVNQWRKYASEINGRKQQTPRSVQKPTRTTLTDEQKAARLAEMQQQRQGATE